MTNRLATVTPLVPVQGTPPCLTDTEPVEVETCLYALDGGRCLDPTAYETGDGFTCPGCASWVCSEDAARNHVNDCYDYFRWVTQ